MEMVLWGEGVVFEWLLWLGECEYDWCEVWGVVVAGVLRVRGGDGVWFLRLVFVLKFVGGVLIGEGVGVL